MPSQLPSVPMQSVPINDDRGRLVDPPALLSRAWWLFVNSLAGFVQGLSDQLGSLSSSQASTAASVAAITSAGAAGTFTHVTTNATGQVLSGTHSTVSAGSVTLAKLTVGGTTGSITFNADGFITAVVAPT